MNGVHCQTSAAMIDGQRRLLVIQSGCGALVAEDALQQPVEQAVLRVVQRVLPQQGRRDRHDQERA